MLWKEKLRPFVYRFSIFKIIWQKIIKRRYQFIFKYWKHINYFYFCYLTKWKGYKTLTFEKKITNGVFKVFVSQDKRTVLKINRKDNFANYKFYMDLKKDANYILYKKIISTAWELEFIGNHILQVEEIFRDGSYKSLFIGGENLKILKMKLIQSEMKQESNRISYLLNAIETLYKNINDYYQKYGLLTGDWMLHNLIFDESSKKIVNIDLEGFYTFRSDGEPNNIRTINKELNSIIDLLKRKNLRTANK